MTQNIQSEFKIQENGLSLSSNPNLQDDNSPFLGKETDKTTDEERAFLFLTAILSILLLILPSLGLVVFKKDLSDFGKDFLYKTLNFELVIVLLMACLQLVPAYGSLISFGVFIFNFVICTKAANSINLHKEFQYPIALNFIKIVQP